MPGSNQRALEKGRGLPADCLLLDLEDAVAPDAKPLARDQIAAAVKAGGYGRRELIVRINSLDGEWGKADAAMAARSGADAILLPKVESAEQVHALDRLMTGQGAPANMAIWCMIETPLGVLRSAEIAAAGERLACFVMGTSDLAKDLQASHTRERLPMLTSLGLCILAARAYRLAILDGVHLDLNDDTGFAESCRQGRELGFDGKTLIHPKTIEAANRAFAPSEAELDFSRRVIEAHAQAAAAGKGVVVVDGRLVENLHVENARRLVALAEAIAEREKGVAS
jgi:citrate lyase subunit beta/citryl-CoA lyase